MMVMRPTLQKCARLLLSSSVLFLAAFSSANAQPTDAKSALTLIRAWQLSHTVYHLHMTTEGQFNKQEGDFYCLPTADGRHWKLDLKIVQPNTARVIFEQAPGDIIAYFPEINKQVLTKALPGVADVLSAGFLGVTAEDRTLEKTKSTSLLSIGGVNQLTLVFDAAKLQMNPPRQAVTTIIRFDNTGQILEVEQRRLGMIQVTKLTYLSFDINVVRARMPVTPDISLVDPNTPFQDALEESVIYFAKQKQLQRNRL
jgi:hypothetical protein